MSDKSKISSPFNLILNRMMDTFAEHLWARLLRSYVLQMRDERKARLATIIRLSVELEKIRSVSIFGTGFHEGIIEAIIEGDWKEVAKLDGFLADPGAEQEKYEELWRDFRMIVLAACADASRRESGQATTPD